MIGCAQCLVENKLRSIRDIKELFGNANDGYWLVQDSHSRSKIADRKNGLVQDWQRSILPGLRTGESSTSQYFFIQDDERERFNKWRENICKSYVSRNEHNNNRRGLERERLNRNGHRSGSSQYTKTQWSNQEKSWKRVLATSLNKKSRRRGYCGRFKRQWWTPVKTIYSSMDCRGLSRYRQGKYPYRLVSRKRNYQRGIAHEEVTCHSKYYTLKYISFWHQTKKLRC